MTRRTFSGLAIGAVATPVFALGGCSDEPKPHTAADIASLEKALGRKVITPASGGAYDDARFIWNEYFDRRPAIIAPCHNAPDVAQCISFARKHGLALAARSGGHHPAGFAMNDGGFVIDLSKMKAIKVDAETRRVIVEPGVLVNEMDRATEPHKLVVPAAACPTVGLGGMTLGGGEGWFSEFGLAIDNLVAAEMVLADGRILRVDKDNEPDLFWAIRGGGGNFGILTSIEFQAHPLQSVMFGLMTYPLEQAKDVVMKLRPHSLAAAPDFASKCIFARNPAPAMIMASKTARPLDQAQTEFAELRAFARPLNEIVKPMGLAEFQLLGAANSSGGRFYAQTHYLADLSPEIVDIAIGSIKSAPTDDATVIIHTQSRGIDAVAVDATAYPHRGPRFAFHAQARWTDAKQDKQNVAWVKEWWRTALPFATGEVSNNYISEVSTEMSRRAYGPNYARLAEIKRRYDPENVFNSAINIKPA